MLISYSRIKLSSLDGSDGNIGTISDMIVDGDQWAVRYIQVNIGKWLPGRIVPLQPDSIVERDWAIPLAKTNVSADAIENSPEVRSPRPVSRAMEVELAKHFDWQPYWSGGFGHELGGVPPLSPSLVIDKKKQQEIESTQVNLRSANEVIGYKVHEADGEMGSVYDLIVDDLAWLVRYIVVDTGNWLPGKKVMLAASWIEQISWTEKAMHLDLTKDQVRGMPQYDPEQAVNRQHEEQLYDYYGRPVYWQPPNPR